MTEYVVGYNHKKGLKISFNGMTPAEKRQKANHEHRMPGDPVPEAVHWKPHVLAAHVNLKWIQTRSDYEASAEQFEVQDKALKAAAARRKEERRRAVMIKRGVQEQSGSKKKEEDTGAYQLASRSKADLMEMCKERGLKVRGTKEEIVKRLEKAIA